MKDKSDLFSILNGDLKNLEKQLWRTFKTIEGNPYDFENNIVQPISNECFQNRSDWETLL